MAEFSENHHISNLINMSCKVYDYEDTELFTYALHKILSCVGSTLYNQFKNCVQVVVLW